MTLVLAALAAPLPAVALFALDRHLRAVRTRRQLLDALVAVPEVAGVAPAAHTDRVAAIAAALARARGVDRRRRACIEIVARLSRLGHIAPPHDLALTPAAAGARVATAAGFPADVVNLLALFATLVDHHRGEERRAAEALVELVQGRPPPV